MEENVQRYNPKYTEGLSYEQVNKRKEENLVNIDITVPTKSIKTIIFKNFFTIFNLINFILALAIFLVGEYKNMLFIMLIVINTAISTIQEIHSKKVIDKLALLSTTKVKCIRNKKEEDIDIDEIVLDDVLKFEIGNQIVVDCIILQGEIEVNESFITGESEPVVKKAGDMIMSGSFVVSGKCFGKVEHIKENNFTSKIANETKYIKQAKSEIMTSLNKIIKIVSVIIIPLGGILFFRELNLDGGILKDAVVHTVAACVGMIPEGLILLTSTVLAVSVIRLSRYNVLVQELFCIETLARVDTLCLDKTGTITEGKMEVNKIVPINISKDQMEEILANFVLNSEDTNATIDAIRQKYNKAKDNWKVAKKIAFSSSKKWSGIEFENKGSFIIGAPEIIIKDNLNECNEYAKDYRVVVLAHSNNKFYEKEMPKDIQVLGFILISDKIRENAIKTLEYFKKQGVDILILSGDSPITVSRIAQRVGIEGFDKYVDCSTLNDEKEVEEAVKKYKIFARVTPIQKKQIVMYLKKMGHTVAMTGDGVNDIIALKESDCSIAMAEGSDAARSVSQLVLLDSNFESMPKIVAEGRRTINNLERSATLFLSKTIYSVILAILFILIHKAYPFMPIQLSLMSLVCIGIPSFVLALEPNKSRVKGKFIENVISKVIPASLNVIFSIIMVCIIDEKLSFPAEIYSTICVILTVLTGFMLIIKISIPFNVLRTVLLASLIGIFVTISITLNDLFSIMLTQEYVGVVIILSIITIFNFIWLNIVSNKILQKRRKIRNGI